MKQVWQAFWKGCRDGVVLVFVALALAILVSMVVSVRAEQLAAADATWFRGQFGWVKVVPMNMQGEPVNAQAANPCEGERKPFTTPPSPKSKTGTVYFEDPLMAKGATFVRLAVMPDTPGLAQPDFDTVTPAGLVFLAASSFKRVEGQPTGANCYEAPAELVHQVIASVPRGADYVIAAQAVALDGTTSKWTVGNAIDMTRCTPRPGEYRTGPVHALRETTTAARLAGRVAELTREGWRIVGITGTGTGDAQAHLMAVCED